MYFHFLSLNFSKILSNIIAFQRWTTLSLFGVGLPSEMSNHPTVNFVSRFIQTKKRNSFRSFSFYLAWEIRSWQILPKTILKHALFFPLEKIILLRSDLIHNDFMLVLFLSWPMNSATVILITTVIINNHNISKAPERHSLLIF